MVADRTRCTAFTGTNAKAWDGRRLTFTRRPNLLPSIVHALFEPLFDALQLALVGRPART